MTMGQRLFSLTQSQPQIHTISLRERILDGVTAWLRAYSSSGHVEAETEPEQFSQAARKASKEGVLRRGPWALQH